MFDLIVRNATLPDGTAGVDIAVVGGRISAVEPHAVLRRARAAEVIDAHGCLLSPPFVDAHFHLDATLSLGLPRVNRSGTLLEGIALWGELKPTLTQDAIIARAMQYCDWAAAQRAARDPHTRRHLRPAPAGGRGAAAGQAPRVAVRWTCSW